jgi:hypothetical protein
MPARFKENSTWQILQFEVHTSRGLAWTGFPRSMSKTYLQEAVTFLKFRLPFFFLHKHNAGMQIPHKNKKNQRR